MDGFEKVIGIVFLALVLGIAIEKTERDYSVLLSVTVCCIASVVAITYLMPVIDFVRKLVEVGNIQFSGWEILLKATGISLVCEISGHICTDAGNTSLAKTLQLLGSAVIISISIPILDRFLSLVQEILAKV